MRSGGLLCAGVLLGLGAAYVAFVWYFKDVFRG
jgi:hypothetical protein